MRGRTFIRASRRIGIERSSMRMVRTAPFPPFTCSTLVTFPTFTPAMRTGELALMSLAVLKAARISKCPRNGTDLVNPR
jgi:hypothetical protein